jgi:predicted ATPase
VLTAQGQEEAGIAQICQGLATWQILGAEAGRPCWLALLAESYGKADQAEEGLRVLAEALAAVQKRGERQWAAELYRLKGELLLRQATGLGLRPVPTEAAEACFRQAIHIARRQRAKPLELQAVMRLSRLWQQQGKREEARQWLGEIYGWFAEGFDTADLREAKALLEELA